MELLKQRILTDGTVKEGNILKVDSFLNHQMDIALLNEIGKEFRRRFDGQQVNKILTIEASGIAIAAAAGISLGVPMVFAKKHKTSNVDGSVYTSKVHSFTHDTDYTIVVSRDYLLPGDKVLLVDDFLANGQALNGLMDLCRQAGAEVAGVSAAIEKGFQGGGDALRAKGVRVESLAVIDSMDDTSITFRK